MNVILKYVISGAFPIGGLRKNDVASHGWGPRYSRKKFKKCSGFTLFEMCIVLVLIAVFVGLISAGLGTAFTEQGLREDTSKLSFCIRSAQLRSEDENVPFLVTLTSASVSLSKVTGDPVQQDDANDLHPKKVNQELSSDEDHVVEKFHDGNQVWLPQDKRLDPWAKVHEVSWVFLPGHLCPVHEKVRWTRDQSWIEETFDPLTGDIEHEVYEFQ